MTADIRTAAQRGGRAWHEEMKALGNRGLYRSRTPSEVMDHFHSSYLVNENGCWIWQRSLSAGYAQMQVDGKNWGVHRWSYINFGGEIPPGMFVCHKCDVPACVNPEHLEQVTHEVNISRIPRERPYGEDRCILGHLMTEKNTFVQKNSKCCRACSRSSKNAWGLKRITCTECGLEITARNRAAHIRRHHGADQKGTHDDR